MYVDNRKGTDSVRAILVERDSGKQDRIVIDVKSILYLFGVLFGVSLATTGVLALMYSMYLALFFK